MFYVKMFKDFLTFLGLIKLYNIVSQNLINLYNNHVSKYYLEHTELNNDIETNKKFLKLIKIKLFFDFVLNIHLVDNKAVNVNKNDILYHNYFNDFHMLILFGHLVLVFKKYLSPKTLYLLALDLPFINKSI